MNGYIVRKDTSEFTLAKEWPDYSQERRQTRIDPQYVPRGEIHEFNEARTRRRNKMPNYAASSCLVTRNS